MIKSRFFFITFFIIIFLLFRVNCFSQYTKLLDFSGITNGNGPCGALISDGIYLYGMTYSGGAADYGVVFKIKPDGSGFVKLLDFDGNTNGKNPTGDLLFDGTYLYGMTYSGGTIFKLRPDGSGYTKLYNFINYSFGYNPHGSLNSAGNFLYGTTWIGGLYGYGVIFKIKPDGSNFLKIKDFDGGLDGKYLGGSLFWDGNYQYGTTNSGGANNMGVIFKIRPGGRAFEILLDFEGTTNGKSPEGQLIFDGLYLYGMTASGGANDLGVIYKIKSDGSGYTKLLDFAGTSNGANPVGSLTSDGVFLYGMTSNGGLNNKGVVFKIKPDGTAFTKLFDFNGSANGETPYGSLYVNNFCLYGMTYYGGAYNKGVIFKYTLPVSINNLNKENSIIIYPNPAVNCLQIKLPLSGRLQIEFYNSLGQLILLKEIDCVSNIDEVYSINIESFSNGIYYVKIKDKDSYYTGRFVK